MNRPRARVCSILASIAFMALGYTAVPAQPASTAAPIADPCGPQILKPSGKPWVCTFHEDFNGTALNPDKWKVLTTATTGNRFECRVDEPENVSVSDGALRLSARHELEPITCPSPHGAFETTLTGGAVSTGRRFAQTYGRFEVRAAMPEYLLMGFHSAIWLFPQENTYGAWPASGEIDINEYRTGLHGHAVPTLHRLRNGEREWFTTWDCKILRPEDYHDFVVEWTRWRFRFIYDGQLCFEKVFASKGLASNRPFDHDFFIMLNQSHGWGLNAPTLLTTGAATMSVDHVRVWR